MQKAKIRTFLKFLILIWFMLFSPSKWAKAEQFLYTRLSDNNWVMSTTYCIYNESNKYLWIATNKGVYRFNGYEFKHYDKSSRENSIPGNDVYRIVTDSIGNFWALTNKGLGLYNKPEDRFDKITCKGIDDEPIVSYCHVDDGILFGGLNKIIKYKYSSGKLELFRELVEEKDHYIQNIYKISEDEIIFNTSNNIEILNIKDKSEKKILFNFQSRISAFYIDTEKRIWIANYNKGLILCNSKGEILKRYTKENGKLTNNVILSIQQQESFIWLGTEGSGINIIDTRDDSVKLIEHIIGDSRSLPSNSINYLYYDKPNTMWAGSIRDGVIRIKKSFIKTYTEVPINNEHGLSNPTILFLYPDHNNKYIWIGTDGEGINRMNLLDKSFEHYPSTLGAKVVSIADYSENELILSLYLRGLFILDKRTGKIRPMNVKNKSIEEILLYTGAAINLCNEDRDNLLILGNKIYRYNLRTHQSKVIKPGTSRSFGSILHIGNRNGYNYFYDNKAMYRLKELDDSVEMIFKFRKDQNIRSVAMDNNGILWLATNTGIATYSLINNTFERINCNLFNVTSCIIPDNKNRVWIGAGTQLYAYQKEEGSFAMFGESDGAIPNEYIKKARILTRDGQIIMGGTRGLLVIDNEFNIEALDNPKLMLTDIYIDGMQLKGHHYDKTKTLLIPSGSKQIEFQVTTIEEDILRPKVYKYEINGKNDLVFESFSPKLTLSSLQPGKSSIFVSCGTRKGEWTKPVRLVTFNVQLPWYETLSFKLSCLSVAIIVFISVLYTQLKMKNNKLKLSIKEKEKDIYEEKVRFLVNVNHELRTPLTLIHAPIKRILQQMSPSDSNYVRLNKIYRQAGRMKKLLNLVLDLRKMEVGEQKLVIASYKVNDWIKSVIYDFTDEGDALGISIKTDMSSDIDFINFDKEKCDIVITNMLVNAIKHSKRGDSIVIKTETTTNKMVRVSVIDEGVGLKDIEPQKLFTRFYQGVHEEYGSGIGLAYSKVLIDQHKGNIGAYSNDKGGATFYFELPISLETGEKKCETRPYLNEIFAPIAREQDRKKTEKEADEFDTTNSSILIVDDSTELTGFLKEALSGNFKDIYTATNGKEAIDIIKETMPTIIVSDVMMQGMNGYELCQKIKSNIEYSHIPVILLTARSDEQSEQQGYKLGADAFLSKPFEVETLLEVIKNKLKARKLIKEKYMQLSILPEPQKDTFSKGDEIFLQKLNTIIKNNLNNTDLDIPFVCKEIGMSRASLYNKLKALTDMGGNEYINKIRMEKAIILIKTTDMNFTDISSETGFASLKYFSATFKQYTGMTPTQFKKGNTSNH